MEEAEDSSSSVGWGASVHKGVVELHGPGTSPSCSAKVRTYGATVVSYIHHGKERLYVSPNAILDGSKAIRGGIPLVFPQFAQPNPAMAQHGFARTSIWSVLDLGHENDTAFAIFGLKSSPETLAVWPHDFELVFTVRLSSSSFSVNLEVRNPSPESSFECQALLHTYLKEDIYNMSAKGFKGYSFLDKVRGGDKGDELREFVTVHEGEVDRIYFKGEEQEMIRNVSVCDASGTNETLRVNVDGIITSPISGPRPLPLDVVLWNAGPERSIAIADLGEGEYKNYVCIEPGHVTTSVRVEGGASFTLSQNLIPQA